MILEITADQIALLNDTDLRELVARLCESEVKEHQHSPAAVTWGGHQDAADGGIDVRVSLPANSEIAGYIPKPKTGFQVKAKPMPRSAILAEMKPGGVPLPSIADLAAKSGAYIIVSSRDSASDSALEDRIDAMWEAVAGLPFAGNLTLGFYDRRRLASWTNQHTKAAAWVREKLSVPLSGWRTFADWSSAPAALGAPYLLDGRTRLIGPSIKDSQGLSALRGINRLREIVRNPKGVVRVAGLSGVGKTRLIQALFDERIGEGALPPSDALYTDVSDQPDPVPQEMLSRLIDLRDRVVMIVDNCGIELHSKLARRIANSNCELSLITVEFDINDDAPEDTEAFRLDPASQDLIEKMLESRYPGIAPPSRQVIARLSEGNSRVAFALAVTAQHGDSLTNLNDGELFKRLFYQQKDASEGLLDAAKACALVYSFDGETLDGDESELRPLAALTGITVDKLHNHVAELLRRQLVQKRSRWRAILPHALANRLAKLALEDIPFQRIEDEIVNSPSGRMLRSFSRRMGYLHDHQQAIRLAEQWFARRGLLYDLGNLSKLGEEILENIAPIKPDATLAFFEATAQANGSFFGQENRNKTAIVRITRSIAYDPTLFDRCVRLLTRFALNETAGAHESAADALQSLFWIYLSGTLASPAQRTSFIHELLGSSLGPEQQIGTALLGAMLKASHFSSQYSFEFGAWKRDFGFYPTDEEQVRHWYARAIEIAQTTGASTSSIAASVRAVLATSIPELLAAGMFNEVLAAADALSGDDGWPEGWIGVRSAIRWNKQNLSSDELKALKGLEQRLSPKALPALIRSYVLSPEWSAFDIAVMDEEELKPSEAFEKLLAFCVELGQQLARTPEQFNTLLPEIVVSTSTKTLHLGRGIAQGCGSLSDCWRRLRAAFLGMPETRRNQLLLAGFLAQAMSRAPEAAETLLDSVLDDPPLHADFVYLQVHTKVNNKAFERLMRSLTLETVPVSSFRQLGMGRAHEGLDDEQFRILLHAIGEKDGGMSVGGEILGMRIFGINDKLSIGEALKATSREFLAKVQIEQVSHLDHLIGDVIEATFDKPIFEEQARALCAKILKSVKSHKVHSWDLGEIITALAKTYPLTVLDVLVVGAGYDGVTQQAIFQDLRPNREHPLDAIPDALRLAWARHKPHTRYADLARVTRFLNARDADHAVEWLPAADTLIAATPKPTEVLEIFLSRFRPSSWSGSLAETLSKRLPLFETLKEHSRPEVAAWAKERAPAFVALIERTRAEEARDDRRRDETFE